MGTDIKLKDLFGQTQTEQDISTVSVPKADGTGREYYVKRPVSYYKLVASPPYAPQEGDNTIIFWNLGDGGFGTEPDTGNCIGGYLEAVEGKTTKPLISITVSKYMEGIEADNSGKAMVLYLYEALAGSTLLELAGLSGTVDFTAQPGWGQLIQGTDGQTYTYTQLTDLSGIAIGIEQPNTILNQRLFYSYLTEKTSSTVAYTATENGAHTIVPPAESSGISAVSLTVDVPESEPNLQDKSVAITENGTQEFSADTGYDGIKKLTATVNVAGGGGAGVQPDYAQNNSAAADYIKNRPGGYTGENPAISKTMAASDYISKQIGMVYKFSDVVLPNEAILGGTGKIKTINNGVETETDISSIVYMGSISGMKQFEVKDSSGLSLGIVCGGVTFYGIEPATWLDANTDDDTGAITAYISDFTTAAYSTLVEIPEKFTEVKPANWGSGEGYTGYITGRPGGYFFSYDDFFSFFAGAYNYTWDGVVGDKETITLNYGGESVTYVKVSTDTPCILAFAGGEIELVVNGQSTTQDIRRDLIDIGTLGAVGIYIENDAGKSGGPMAILSFGNPSFDANITGDTLIPQGVWFAYVVNASGTTDYCSKIDVSSSINTTFRAAMPYELVEQHPNALTTDAQTLTDDQKLQARTNIGTVAGTDKEMILSSSTAGSAKKFKITVTDDGALTATEVTQ